MSVLLKLRAFVLVVWLTVAVSVGSIVLFVAQFVLSMKVYSRFCCTIQAGLLGPLTYFMEVTSRVQIRMTGDTLPTKESAFVLPNHLNHDCAPLCSLAMRQGMLGNVRCVLKDVIKYIPGFGWGIYMMNWPLLKRTWVNDQKYLESKMKTYKEAGIPLHVWMFPEGTRLTPAKMAASQKFAAERKMAPLQYCMQPRVKGFVALSKGLKGICTHIYDVTLRYEGWDQSKKLGPSTGQIMFASNDKCVFHIHIKRIPLEDLPLGDDKALTKWCYDMFQEKDKLLKHYEEHKTFPGKVNPVEPADSSVCLNGFVMYTTLMVGMLYLLRCVGVF